MRSSPMFWIIVTGAIAIGIWLVSLYNKMVKRKNRVEDSWSHIDIQLNRRHNLIPNLVEIVKKYAPHEKDIMETVIKLNNMSKNTADNSANQEQLISNALNTLMIQVETCVELNSNDNFHDIEKQLIDIEKQIQYACRHFNATVREYNTLLQSFPAVLIAQKLGFQEAEFFKLFRKL